MNLNKKVLLSLLLFLSIVPIIIIAHLGEVGKRPLISYILYLIPFISIYILAFRIDYDSDTEKKVGSAIIFFGILLRLIFIYYPASNDVKNYAWGGHVQNSGINPYVTAPVKLDQTYSDDPIFMGMNHRDVPAAYPPVTMMIFKIISRISYSLISFKIFFVSCDILNLFLLWKLVSLWGRPPPRLSLYALNPLVIIYGAGEGHLDVMHILFILSSLIFFYRSYESEKYRIYPILAYLLLGTAVMTKYLSILILPFVVTRKNLKYLPFFLLPFCLYLNYLGEGMFTGASTFSAWMAYNDFFPRLIREFTSGSTYVTGYVLLLTSGLVFIWLIYQRDRMQGVLFSYLWCILCIPTVHPWYLMPIPLFLISYPHRAAWLLMMAMGLQFWVSNYWLETGNWIEFGWIWKLTYFPFLAALIHDKFRSGFPWSAEYAPPLKIDIIIPVLNEEKRLVSLLDSINRSISFLKLKASERAKMSSKESAIPDFNIIVADGGSTDNTQDISEDYSISFIMSPKGRGNQLSAGYNTGHGELVLMLHADTVLKEDALFKLVDYLNNKRSVAWGVMGHRYERLSLTMYTAILFNFMRFKLFGIAFGDQGIFARRSVLDKAGGIPAISLMEDVEISIMLSHLHSKSLGSLLLTSQRRWENKSAVKNFLHIIYNNFIYLTARRLGLNRLSTADFLYTKYYKETSK